MRLPGRPGERLVSGRALHALPGFVSWQQDHWGKVMTGKTRPFTNHAAQSLPLAAAVDRAQSIRLWGLFQAPGRANSADGRQYLVLPATLPPIYD